MDASVNSRTYIPIEQVKQHITSADSDMGKNREDSAVEDTQESEDEVKEEFNTYFDLFLCSDKIGQDL